MNFLRSIVVLFHTLFTYFLSAFVITFLVLPLLVTLLFVPADNNRFVFFLLDLFYKSILFILFVPLQILGKENIPQEPSIIVGNHQSSLDIVLVGSLMQRHPHTWYALAYYAHVFFLGFFVRRLGIPVSHENGGSAARALIDGIKFAQTEQGHIILFPEGGRFADGTVHEFWKGFALLARSSKRPVVPVFMPYNGKVKPPFSFWLYWHPLVAVVGPQFLYQENDTDEIFVERVYTWFVQENKKYNQ